MGGLWGFNGLISVKRRGLWLGVCWVRWIHVPKSCGRTSGIACVHGGRLELSDVVCQAGRGCSGCFWASGSWGAWSPHTCAEAQRALDSVQGSGGVAPGSCGISKIYFLTAVVLLSVRETSQTPGPVAASCAPRPSAFSFAHSTWYLESHLLLEAFLFKF